MHPVEFMRIGVFCSGGDLAGNKDGQGNGGSWKEPRNGSMHNLVGITAGIQASDEPSSLS
ncbi:hypothetical protein TRIP_B330660 [uncultured Desulfatiglans sp.]|uniref:Uncharacterized protein n=1 Tax=Uncultured Desulfatiglans sp. TaxID=1748965 RepID=A0A653A8Z3_UNCDX|nr:hypothetical protein TRIP_B330660 [uncultured Desulfatiglans sp.]